MTGYTYFGDLRICIEQCEEVLQRMSLVLQASGSLSDDHPGVTILMSCNRLSDKNEPNEISFQIGHPLSIEVAHVREIITRMERGNYLIVQSDDAVGIKIELPKWQSSCGNLIISVAVGGLYADENRAVAMRMLEIASECDAVTIFQHVEKAGWKLAVDFSSPGHCLYRLLNI